jgi:Zn-dependent M16 (insulinase) family peptidase
MADPLAAEGQRYRGFLIVKYFPLEELNSTLIELVHESTGARVVQIANDDPENLFALCFQTLPTSSNGAAHILEHTVLCGSKKFPVKDPFFSMARRSLNTYMNALTGQDFTIYPASSQVKRDFYNLLEVYLDAVFHPLLNPLSFLQEGHRLCFSSPSDPTTPLQIQGVVYNEMKGAMNSSDERLFFEFLRHLMPDLPYAFNSGGDPSEIPFLTYEELCEFHHTFYHPSRCLFYFYGDLPLADHLEFIEQHALSGVEKLPAPTPLVRQKRMGSPIHVQAHYPVIPSQTGPQTIIAIGYLTASISHPADLLALSLIDRLLMDTDASPLKRALIDSELCSSAESYFDTEISEAPWLLVCKGCEEHSAGAIEEVVRCTLEKLAQEGFRPEAIEASLHQLEFERLEMGADRTPFGLTLCFRAMVPKLHGIDAEYTLPVHSLFSELRTCLANPSWLPSLLRRYWLDNTHAVRLTMKPDPDLHQKEEAQERLRLEATRAQLTPEKLQRIVTNEQKLADWQKETEHQSIQCLPTVSLKDIPIHARDFPLVSSTVGTMSFHRHHCFTNHILYADLHYDLPAIDFADWPLISIFTQFWTEIGCAGRSYTETVERHQAVLGDIGAALSLFVQHGRPDQCWPTISLRGRALARNQFSLLDILRETSQSPDFNDPPRIKELVREMAIEMQNSLSKDAMSYATQMALSSLSTPSAIHHQMGGLPYFDFVRKAAKDPSQLIEPLVQLANRLIGRYPSLVVSCSADQANHLSASLETFAASLPSRSLPGWPLLASEHQNPNTRSQHSAARQCCIISSPVAFSALAYQTVADPNPDAPALMIAANLMENVVLHKEIREKGGAYGGGANYLPSSGHFYFYSYRDPHIAGTYRTFLFAIEQIAAQKFSERELFEAKLGIIQTIDTPLPPRKRASCAFGWLRSKCSFAQRNALRRAIIEASPLSVATAVGKHLLPQIENGSFASFAGKELFQKERLPFSTELREI